MHPLIFSFNLNSNLPVDLFGCDLALTFNLLPEHHIKAAKAVEDLYRSRRFGLQPGLL